MSLKLYYDSMSPPCRALYILLKTSKCNFEPKLVDMGKGHQLRPEYGAINRFKKIPAIDHNGFILMESVAITKYLAREKMIPKTLYSEDSKAQARVDEYLAWQHVGLKLPSILFFMTTFINPLMTGKSPDPKQVDSYKQKVINALEEIDRLWLGYNKFVTGDTINVADLFAAVDLEQLKLPEFNFDPAADFPNIAKWWPKVREHFNPCYEEAHVVLHKVIKSNASKVNKNTQ
ncbi:glutathione S-transferase theta-4 [Pieris rapae]|uniref:glutathione S-transferase theta-4 n=1 Tax=Pieris rapae TaxID=64459 RepID=UPI001E27BACE|nr:glutathione S-transferase theta-4 [Pieris rapae]